MADVTLGLGEWEGAGGGLKGHMECSLDVFDVAGAERFTSSFKVPSAWPCLIYFQRHCCLSEVASWNKPWQVCSRNSNHSVNWAVCARGILEDLSTSKGSTAKA